MKKTNFIFTVFLLLTGIFIYAGASLVYFQVTSLNEQVIIEWQTQEEVSLTKFEILRKAGNGNFAKIGEVKAAGSFSTYKYIDKNIFKTTQNNYTYKLRFINTKGQPDGYSAEKSILPNISSVKRTWGSIKALFR